MNNNNFYKSYDRPNYPNFKYERKSRTGISSPLKKEEDILFIPCINCNQLVKINEIEKHSETCIAYSNNIENKIIKDKNKKYFLNENSNYQLHKNEELHNFNLKNSPIKTNVNHNYCKLNIIIKHWIIPFII